MYLSFESHYFQLRNNCITLIETFMDLGHNTEKKTTLLYNIFQKNVIVVI